MKRIINRIAILLILILVIVLQIEVYQTCKTDIQITFKNGLNVVTGLTEGIKIYK